MKCLLKYFLALAIVLHFVPMANAQKADFRRACVHANSSDVVLQWSSLVDPCGTFISLHIYARENSTVPYVFIDSVSDQTTLSYTHTGAFLLSNKWQYFIVYRLMCDNTESISDTLFIDLVQPGITEIDSVSIDEATENAIIAWKKNPAPDLMGYSIWVSDSTNNTKLDDLDSLQYLHQASDKTQPNSYRLSVFDSCGNQSVISSFHSTIFLKQTADSCTRSSLLEWTAYVGHPVDSYVVYVRVFPADYEIDTVLSGNSLSTKLFFNKGDSVQAFVRARGKKFSSRSNSVSFKISGSVVPAVNYIHVVTVPKNNVIEVKTLFDNRPSFERLFLMYRTKEENSFDTLYKENITSVSDTIAFSIQSFDTETIYDFKQIILDKCGLHHHSATSNNIVASVKTIGDETFQVSWNPYLNWDAGVGLYEIKRGTIDVPRETWELIAVTTDTFITDFLSTDYEFNTLCYSVMAREDALNSYGYRQDSYSNQACSDEPSAVYFPSAIKPNGQNPKFIIKGKGLDLPKSRIRIFNRYGQLLFDGPLTHSWDGTDLKGNPVPEGVYIYYSVVYGIDGSKQTHKGNITVLY